MLIGLDEGSGKLPVNLITVHSQDHLMNAMVIQDLALCACLTNSWDSAMACSAAAKSPFRASCSAVSAARVLRAARRSRRYSWRGKAILPQRSRPWPSPMSSAFIQADKLGLNFMRMFDELMGLGHGLLRCGKIALE
jgi:hypothetical protein